MKKLSVLCTTIALMFMISAVSAQITITQGSVIGIGESYTSYSPQSLNGAANPGSAGANQSWSIPEGEVVSDAVIMIEDPATTEFTSDFPTATHAYTASLNGQTTGWSFMRLESNALFSLGFAGSSGLTIVTVYNPEGYASPLPLTFGTSGWTTLTRWSYEPAPTIMITQTDSTIVEVDGWGTMTTQFGSFNVLRQKQHHFSINVSENPFTPPIVTETSYWSYAWVTENGTPVVTMTSDPNETDPNFTQGTVSLLSFGTVATEPVRGPIANSFSLGQNYPNPFNPTTSLPISLEQAAEVEITIFNELGEVISRNSYEFGPGQHTVPFNGNRWASGNYFAQVRAGEQLLTKRMTLVK